MVNPNPVGILGERLACDYLTENHYSIIAKNYTTRFGEIDIICEKDDAVIFIEVKTRVTVRSGMPHEAVTFSKMVRLRRAIDVFLLSHPYGDRKMSVWVIGIILTPELKAKSLKVYDGLPIPR